MSLRSNIREYRKAAITIFSGIGLIIVGFIIGFASIALGIALIYSDTTTTYSYTTNNSNSELFKWAVSVGIFGFACIIVGYGMIGGGCRMCFSSCGECFSSGCTSCSGGCCESLSDLEMGECCGCIECGNDGRSVDYSNYEAKSKEHSIVHLEYENKQEVPLEVIQMQQKQDMPVQMVHGGDVKMDPNVPTESNNYSNESGGFSGVVNQQVDESTSNTTFYSSAVTAEQTIVYHQQENSNTGVIEISAPTL